VEEIQTQEIHHPINQEKPVTKTYFQARAVKNITHILSHEKRSLPKLTIQHQIKME